MSSTSPSASMARHNQNFFPLIVMKASSICHLSFGLGRFLRMQAAKCWPKSVIQRRTDDRPRRRRRQLHGENETPSNEGKCSVNSCRLDRGNAAVKQLGNTIKLARPFRRPERRFDNIRAQILRNCVARQPRMSADLPDRLLLVQRHPTDDT